MHRQTAQFNFFKRLSRSTNTVVPGSLVKIFAVIFALPLNLQSSGHLIMVSLLFSDSCQTKFRQIILTTHFSMITLLQCHTALKLGLLISMTYRLFHSLYTCSKQLTRLSCDFIGLCRQLYNCFYRTLNETYVNQCHASRRIACCNS